MESWASENHYEQKLLNSIESTLPKKEKEKVLKRSHSISKKTNSKVGDQRIILAVNKQNPSYHFYLHKASKSMKKAFLTLEMAS